MISKFLKNLLKINTFQELSTKQSKSHWCALFWDGVPNAITYERKMMFLECNRCSGLLLECWSAEMLECWSAGLLEPGPREALRMLECWNAGMLDCWSAGFPNSWTLDTRVPGCASKNRYHVPSPNSWTEIQRTEICQVLWTIRFSQSILSQFGIFGLRSTKSRISLKKTPNSAQIALVLGSGTPEPWVCNGVPLVLLHATWHSISQSNPNQWPPA